jgi:hypothetical protein
LIQIFPSAPCSHIPSDCVLLPLWWQSVTSTKNTLQFYNKRNAQTIFVPKWEGKTAVAYGKTILQCTL